MSSTQLPGGWHSQVSNSTGETYYVNSETLDSTYDFPKAPTKEYLAKNPTVANAEQQQLPEGWQTQVSRSTGETYYVNAVTGASQYEIPTAPAGTKQQIAALPGAKAEKPGMMQQLAKRFKSPKKDRAEDNAAPIAAPLDSVQNLQPKAELPEGLTPGMQVTSKIQLQLRDGRTLKVGAIGHINGPAQTGKADMVHVHFGMTGDDVDMHPYQIERAPGNDVGTGSVSTAGEGSKEQRRKADTKLAEVERGLREEARSAEHVQRSRSSSPARRGRSQSRGRSHRGSRSRSRSRSRSPTPLKLSPSRSDLRSGDDLSNSDAEEIRVVSPISSRHDSMSYRVDGRRPEVEYVDYEVYEDEDVAHGAVDSNDVSGTWEVETEDGRGRPSILELVLHQHSVGAVQVPREIVVTGREGDADRSTPFKIDGSIDPTGTALTFTQRYTVEPHLIRYWRAEVSRDGSTMRGVWATDEDGVVVDGATWKSSRHAPESINFGMLTRRGRGVVEFSARRIDTAVDGRSSVRAGADVADFDEPQMWRTATQSRSPRLHVAAHDTLNGVGMQPSWERSTAGPRRLRTRTLIRSPLDSPARGSSVALLDDERQELLHELEYQVARTRDAERRLHRVEQELGCTRDALAAAEQRAMVAEEWRKHAETKQIEAESVLLEADEVREDALSETEEVARELSAHQDRIRETERALSFEQREREALQDELEKANLREAAMEKALDNMTNQLGAVSEAAATATEAAAAAAASPDKYWRLALGLAGVALVMAVFASVWGIFGVLVLLLLLSYPVILARAFAPDALSRAVAEVTGSKQMPGYTLQGPVGPVPGVAEAGVTGSTSADHVREQQWLEWGRHMRASNRDNAYSLDRHARAS